MFMVKKIVLALLLFAVVAVVVFFAPGFLAGDFENETKIIVNEKRDVVWAKFQDASKMGKWLENFKGIETIEEKPGKIGSKYRLRFDNNGSEIVMTETMTAFKESERFGFVLENEVMHSEVDVKLIDKGLVTEFVQKEKFHGQNVFWHSLFYWIESTMADNSKKNLDNFKKYAEGA